MLSLFDILRKDRANAHFDETYGNRRSYMAIEVLPQLIASPDDELWLCFPGFLRVEICLYNAWGMHNILPKRGKVVVINGPDAIAGVTPYDTIEAMEALGRKVEGIIQEHPGYSVNVFSISAGTFPGFYFANRHKARRLIAIAPGPRMGQGIYTSIFSSSLRRKCIEAGFPTWQDYDRVITKYNQENNVAGLPEGRNLMIFGSRFDRVIRNSGTREIVATCRRANKNPTFRNYWFFGHTALGAWIAGMNKLGFDPYGVKEAAPSAQSRSHVPAS